MNARTAIIPTSVALMILLGACRPAKAPGAEEEFACFDLLKMPDYPIAVIGVDEAEATAQFQSVGGRTVVSVQATPAALKSAIEPQLIGSRLRSVCKNPVTIVYRFRNPGTRQPHVKWELRYPNILTVFAENYGGQTGGFIDYLRPSLPNLPKK